MRGLQPRPKKSNAVDDPTAQPKLGLIKGKGTGTSDDIKAQVPTGGFIMPADSTKKMGAENLDELGYNDTVPANVSNGEYQMPPEQVHAVGAQVLDQMRNQTHEFSGNNAASMNPIDYAQQGGGNGDNKPELFFADGTPPRRDTEDGEFNPLKGLYNANVGAAKGLASGLLVPFGVAADSLRAAGRHASNAETDPATRMKYTEANAQNSNDGFEQAQNGLRQFFGLKKGPDAIPEVAPVAATAPATPAKVNPPVQTSAQANQPTTNNSSTPPPAAPVAQQPAQPQVPAAGLPNNIIRDGNSFSGQNIGAGYTINGQPSGMTATNPQANSAQNQQAVQGLLARTPEFGQGMGIDQAALNNARQQAGAINAAQGMQAQRYEDRQRIENDLRMARSAMPVGNAQGQTKTQQEMVANLQNQLNAVSAQGYDEYKNQTNNNAALDKQLMGDNAANARVGMQEAGATARNTLNNQTDFGKFGLTNNLENRKFNSDEQAKAPANQQAQRIESLRQQYDAAKTPEDRKSILERINEISGVAKASGDRFKAVNGPETVDPTTRTAVKGAPLVFDTQTGQFVGSGVPQAAANGTSNKKMEDGETYTDTVTGKTGYWKDGRFVELK